MKVSRILTGIAALLLACILAAYPAVARGQSGEKMDLRILYAGHPGSDREKDFVEFLGRYFQQIRTADLGSFQASQAADSDVIILDYDGRGFKAPRPRLPRTYTRPTITVGVVGALICDRVGLKTGYL